MERRVGSARVTGTPVGPIRSSNGPEVLDSTPTFDAFFTSSYPRMVRFAAALLPASLSPEDAVQEAYARTFPRFASLDDPDAYVRRAIVNQATGLFRRRGTARSKEPLLRPDDASREYDTLLPALDALPARQRAALILRFYQQCTEAEIAAALGCRPGTVKSLLSRGVAALRKVIDSD